MKRDLEKVRHDVEEGLISAERAKEQYGVSIDPATNEIDEELTALLREESKSATKGSAS